MSSVEYARGSGQARTALDLVSTVRHDGHGGVADDLATPEGLAVWLAGAPVTEELRAEIVQLRRAVRALFAHAVRPGPPSPADAHRLMPFPEALAHLNECAAREPVHVQLEWEPGGEPHAELRSDSGALVPQLARAAVEFLSGPERSLLRACTAPRCVRYYVKGHGRQEYCKPSCGNRARAARHYQRQKNAI